VIHNRRPVGKALGLVHVVRGQDNGSFLRQCLDKLAHLHAALGVQPGLGFVQYKQLRIVDQGQRQVQPALHAARKRARLAIALFNQAQVIQQGRAASFCVCPIHPIHAPHKNELFHAGQPLPHHHFLRAKPNDAARLAPGQRTPIQQHQPGIGLEQPANHLDGCGFPGAVRPQQSQNFATAHFQIQAVHSRETAIAARQVNSLQDHFAVVHCASQAMPLRIKSTVAAVTASVLSCGSTT